MPIRAVGQNEKDYARFFHTQGRASKRLGVGMGGVEVDKGAESVRASLSRSCDSSERTEESRTGRSFGLRGMADPTERRLLKFLWPRAPEAWFSSLF